MKYLHLLFYYLVAISCNAQVLHRPYLFILNSLGVYSHSFTDVLGSGCNPAGLAALKKFQAGACIDRRFNLSELQSGRISAAYPFGGSCIGLTAKYFGFSGFNQAEFILGYGKELGKMNIGAAFSYQNLKIPAYGSAQGFGISIGAIVHLTSKMTAGCVVINPISNHNAAGTTNSFVYQLGIGYEASDAVLVSVAINKEEEQPLDGIAGILYRPDRRFFFGTGILLGAGSPYGQAGFHWKQIRMIIRASFNSQLGISNGICLIFQPLSGQPQ